MNRASPLIAFLLAPLFLACEPEAQTPKAEGCGSGQSQIRVGDGFFEVMCGCDEADGSKTVESGTFTCTASAPRTVIFHFEGARLRHRVLSTGSGALSFPSSTIHDPSSDHPLLAHGVTLSATGDYTFEDDFQPLLRGVLRIR